MLPKTHIECTFKRGYKYILTEPCTLPTGILGEYFDQPYYAMNLEGEFTLKKHYASDGPSGPTIDTNDTLIASFLHDGLMQAFNDGLLFESHKKIIDRVFHAYLKAAIDIDPVKRESKWYRKPIQWSKQAAVSVWKNARDIRANYFYLGVKIGNRFPVFKPKLIKPETIRLAIGRIQLAA